MGVHHRPYYSQLQSSSPQTDNYRVVMALLTALLVGCSLATVLMVVVGVGLSRHASFERFMSEQSGRGKTLWSRTSNSVTEAMRVDLVDHRIRATADACTVDLEENNMSSSCVLTEFRPERRRE